VIGGIKFLADVRFHEGHIGPGEPGARYQRYSPHTPPVAGKDTTEGKPRSIVPSMGKNRRRRLTFATSASASAAALISRGAAAPWPAPSF